MTFFKIGNSAQGLPAIQISAPRAVCGRLQHIDFARVVGNRFGGGRVFRRPQESNMDFRKKPRGWWYPSIWHDRAISKAKRRKQSSSAPAPANANTGHGNNSSNHAGAGGLNNIPICSPICGQRRASVDLIMVFGPIPADYRTAGTATGATGKPISHVTAPTEQSITNTTAANAHPPTPRPNSS